jgi:hypothetical protein
VPSGRFSAASRLRPAISICTGAWNLGDEPTGDHNHKMAKSARASAVKKNKAGLKKKVFGPVESARNERLNAKLLELAQQAKPLQTEMEVENEGEIKCRRYVSVNGADTMDVGAKTAEKDADDSAGMDVDATARADSKKDDSSDKKRSSSRVQKMRHRRARNAITFAPTGHAKSKKRSKR